jgi:hypothetical protein
VVWGVAVGVIHAASPLAFWWRDPSTVYALGLVLIAAVYIGFAVADGRPGVIVTESAVASVFVVVAAVAVRLHAHTAVRPSRASDQCL